MASCAIQVKATFGRQCPSNHSPYSCYTDNAVARYPRKHFKESFLRAYFDGFAHKPGTTFGTVNAGVCERFIPGYKSPNAVDAIAASSFPDSE